VALLAYPVLIEPGLTLSEQANWWRWGYLGYVGLVPVCAAVVYRNAGEPGALATEATPAPAQTPAQRRAEARRQVRSGPEMLSLHATNNENRSLRSLPGRL